MDYDIRIGMKTEIEKIVKSGDTAVNFGNKAVDVLATPIMIAWMEEACVEVAKEVLREGYETVGTSVNIKHLAATPVGMAVRIITEVTDVKGKIITFKIKAYDEKDKIGEGIHERAVIELGKFLDRIKSK